MSQATRLAGHIERTITGQMWHGPALNEVLDGVTHQQAAARPIAGAHSIWEMVLHAAVWAEIARARVKGDRLGDPTPDEDWPAPDASSPEAWQRARDRLAESHRLLAADVRPLTDDVLKAKVGNLDYTVAVLLHGVVEHSTYHGGQIVMLRKALAASRSS
jgi:uncharacterized damage-inducible protein DinB